MVAILDLAATTTLAGLRHTRALAEGRGLSRERPSGHAEGHAKSQDERRDQQRYTLLHLISPLSLIVLSTIGPMRDAWRVKAHATKPHPFRYVGGGALSLGLSLS